MAGKRDTVYSPELSFRKEGATACVIMPQSGAWCLQRLLLVPAAVAATCQHTPHLGTTEPRAWGKEKNVSPNQLLFVPQESLPPVCEVTRNW